MVRHRERNSAAMSKKDAPGRTRGRTRGGLFSRFVNYLKKKILLIANRSALQKHHEVAPSPSPQPQDHHQLSSHFNANWEPNWEPKWDPNWSDFALAGPIDLDELSSTDEQDPCTSSSCSSSSQEKLDNRLTVMYQPGDEPCDVDSARLQPLSRRILVHLVEAMEILEGAPAAVTSQPESKGRSRGNASLGESQPRQPPRHHHHLDGDNQYQSEWYQSSSISATSSSKRKHRRGPSTENMDTADDLSFCSGITMDSGFDSSTFYGHGESILASLLPRRP